MANVTLRKKPIANDKTSLYLDYFPPVVSPKTGKETRREFLKLKIHNNPSSKIEREHNKTTIEFAELIRAKRLVQIKNREFGFKENVEININFVDYYETIVTEYFDKGSKPTYFAWKSSLGYFKKFIGKKLSSKNLTPEIIKNYRAFLLTTNSHRNENSPLATNTAATYYKHFIFVLKRAFRENITTTNLAQHADYIKAEETFREYLSEDELVLL